MSLAENYMRIKEEIAEIAIRCGRSPEEITLIVVSKNQPWERLLSLYEAGCHLFGENRVQEGLQKISVAPNNIQWHLIGTLQKNKVNKAIGKFDCVHSVDSFELANKINEISQDQKVITSILLQVNISRESTKQGMSDDYCRANFEKFLTLKSVKIKGLMTIGPVNEKEAQTRKCFASLRELKDELHYQYASEVNLIELSMGMSQDFPLAIREGSTLLRIGSAIFGKRDL